jgi:hypothetical protein
MNEKESHVRFYVVAKELLRETPNVVQAKQAALLSWFADRHCSQRHHVLALAGQAT